MNRRLQAATKSWSDMSDEELLQEYCQHGTRAAFDTLVHRYECEVYSYLRRYLGDESQAEDAFQSTFLQVHLKCDQFDPGRSFRPWLYTIATNQAIDLQRRNKRHRLVSLDRKANQDGNEDSVGALMDLLVSKDSGPASHFEADQRREWVQKAVAELPDSLRSAVSLVYYQGLKYREAAEVLNVPVGTVKSRVHTAVLKLNEAWHADHPS